MKLKMNRIIAWGFAMVLLLGLSGCVPYPVYSYNRGYGGYAGSPYSYYSPGYAPGYYAPGVGFGFRGGNGGFGHGFHGGHFGGGHFGGHHGFH